MRPPVLALALALAILSLAGCVKPAEERYVVRVFGGEGATVEVPVPLDAELKIPEFVQAVEFVQGRGTFAFVDTERGPGLRIQPADDTVTLSAREFGGRAFTLTLRENGTLWASSDRAGVNATLVVGHTEAPDCPETSAAWTWGAAGWVGADVSETKRCG